MTLRTLLLGLSILTLAHAAPGKMTPPTALNAKTVIALPAGVDPIKFEGAEVMFKGKVTRTVTLELARDDQQQARGLMYRPSLERNSGMLFLDNQMGTGAFWMKNTLIPLDIAFFDATGKINDILQMPPCTKDPCPVYQPKFPYIGSIEMNVGWFKKVGIVVGNVVSFKLKL